jgi:hypothetical protein
MNRKWRFLRATLWIAVFVAVVAIGAVGFRGLHHEGAMMSGHAAQLQAAQQLPQQSFGKHIENSHFQAPAEYRLGHGERHGFHGGGLAALLVSLLMVAAGWKLWKHAGRTGRWIGGLLIALALLPLVIPAAVIYLLWRILRRPAHTEAAVAYAFDYTPTPLSPVDSLDEWEAKTRRELKNKEEQ